MGILKSWLVSKVPDNDLLLEEEVNLGDTTFLYLFAALALEPNEFVSVALSDCDGSQLVVDEIVSVHNQLQSKLEIVSSFFAC